MDALAVQTRDLGKRYKVYPDSWSRIVEWATRGRIRRHREAWALQGVTIDVPKASALGVVGANGAGKSTLLKILTGTTQPTTGSFQMNGRVGSLLELGAGFHPEFSGRDNVFMNAAIMGVPKREVRARYAELADFAELGDYLDRPVRMYSSGMSMRLGFAVALMVRPDILILDEVLAVGDQHFAQKCSEKMREVRQSGTTILLVSHSVQHVRSMCDRAMWIHDGRVVSQGDPVRVTDEYVNFQYALGSGQVVQMDESHGANPLTAMPHLTSVTVTAAGSTAPKQVFESGETVDIHLAFRNPKGTGAYHLGVIVNRTDDVQVFTTRSLEFGKSLRGHEGSLVLRVPLKLAGGEFFVSGYLLDETCDLILDQRLAWCRFTVTHEGPEQGVFLADARWLRPEEAR